MSPPHGPFTIAVCARCSSGADENVLVALKAMVRGCRHGMLLVTGCLLATLTCAGRRDPAGVVVMVQPCTIERGTWDGEELPDHLRTHVSITEYLIRRN